MELALVGAPVQWAFVAVLIVLVVAPGLAPRIGRVAGMLFRDWISAKIPGSRRRVNPARILRHLSEPPVENPVAPPQVRDSEPQPAPQVPPGRSIVSRSWFTVVLASTATGIILWYLLHSR